MVSLGPSEPHDLPFANHDSVALPVTQVAYQARASWAPAVIVVDIPALYLPRLAGVTLARYLLFGANTPLWSVRSASGKTVHSWQVVVSDSRNMLLYTTLPDGAVGAVNGTHHRVADRVVPSQHQGSAILDTHCHSGHP
jgi:hypothetical protein